MSSSDFAVWIRTPDGLVSSAVDETWQLVDDLLGERVAMLLALRREVGAKIARGEARKP